MIYSVLTIKKYKMEIPPQRQYHSFFFVKNLFPAEQGQTYVH